MDLVIKWKDFKKIVDFCVAGMAELKILFRVEDVSAYQTLDSARVLKEGHRDAYTGIAGVVTRYFDYLSADHLSNLGCFVSSNYEADYGDFTDFNNPNKLQEKFGPAHVFGMGLNTGERHLMEGNLREALRELERIVPEAKKKLSYVGILYCDPSLIFKGEKKELADALLKE